MDQLADNPLRLCSLGALRFSINARPNCKHIFLLLFLALLTTGCVTLTDPEGTQTYQSDNVATLGNAPGQSQVCGQTFVSRRQSLNGLTLWLEPASTSPEGSPTANDTSGDLLTLELYLYPQGKEVLFTSTYSTRSITRRTPFHFQFPPRYAPPGQAYQIVLKASGKALVVKGRGEDAYPYGEAFCDQHSLQADMAFSQSYDYDLQAMREDLGRFLNQGPAYLLAGLVLLLPGWLLLELAGLAKKYDFGERIALASGLSLGVIPLVMLWTSLTGLRWTQPAVRGAIFLLAVLAAVQIGLRIKGLVHTRLASTKNTILDPVGAASQEPSPVETTAGVGERRLANQDLGPRWATLALAAIFTVSLLIRLAMVRDLATPAWVDSVHHALITRLILEGGAYPQTYEPALSTPPTAFHPGFHSALSTFIWLSGIDIPRAMLLFGQVLNVLSIFAAYLWTTTLVGNRTAGIVAALVTGLITPMPAYYASWGRYTQLAGLLILPACLALARPAMEGRLDRKEWKSLSLVGVGAAGLILVHYRVAAFLALLFVAILVTGWFYRRSQFPRALLACLLSAILAGVLSSPWLIPTLRETVLPGLTPTGTRSPLLSDFSWQFLAPALGYYALLAAGTGLAYGLLIRKQFSFALSLWILGLLFLASLGALGLPGGSFVNLTSVEITLFLPVSLLAGFLASQLIQAGLKVISGAWHWLYAGGWVLAGCLVAVFGAQKMIPIMNTGTVLTRAADLPALEWVKENIPPGQTILINPFLWGYGLYAGSDGGFWILPLTGRNTLPPPVLYGAGSAVDKQRIVQASQQVVEHAADAQAIWQIMQEAGIRYVFIGQRGGPLSPHKLQESRLFQVLYSHKGVWVFETAEK